MANIRLSKKKTEEIESFLQSRFNTLDSQRSKFDEAIQEEIDVYNDVDKYVDAKEDWEEKIKVPYIYSTVQTLVSKLLQSLFGDDNYIRIYLEDKKKIDFETDLQKWFQETLDSMRFKYRARDFIEEALVERLVWIQLRPVMDGRTFKKVDFDVYSWYDVWFDTRAKCVEDTDIFVKKVVKWYQIDNAPSNVYFNKDSIKESTPPDYIKDRQKYEAKHGESQTHTVYYDPAGNNTTDEVELLEWYGVYDISTDPKNPQYEHVTFTLANRKTLVRAETSTLKTQRKHLFYPIRPIRQANTLIGKSVPQLAKHQQYELNEVRSLRMQNFKILIGLLWKYRRGAGIDMEEVFAEGGNMIGFDNDPDDIQPIQTPNLMGESAYMSREIVQDIQQIVGAIDFLDKGTETATETRAMAEQSFFKIGMLAGNIYADIIDCITGISLLWMKHGKKEILVRKPTLKEYFDQTEEEIENSYMIDIALQDLAMRRDVERAQFVNAINIIGTLLPQVGGNPKELLRQVMKAFKMENIDQILEDPNKGKQDLTDAVLGEQARRNQERGGTNNAAQINPNAMPDEVSVPGNTPV